MKEFYKPRPHDGLSKLGTGKEKEKPISSWDEVFLEFLKTNLPRTEYINWLEENYSITKKNI